MPINRRKQRTSEQNEDSGELDRVVKQAMNGEREALATLCQTIAKDVLFRVKYLMNNQKDSEDLAQEILIRVCEKIGNLREPKAFRGWLNTIILNETRTFSSRNAKRDVILDLEEFLDTSIDEDEDFIPDEYVVKEEEREELISIIMDLPERQKEAILLRYYDNMNVMEIARVMDISHQAVARYLKLALDKIKREVQTETKKTGLLSNFSLMPIGSLISKVLRYEAGISAPLKVKLIGSVAAEAVGLTAKAGIAGISISTITTVTIAAASVIIATIGLFIGGVFSKPKEGDSLPVEVVQVTGEIVFSGGDKDVSYLNPTKATAWAADEYDSRKADEWTISVIGSKDILYSGQGDIVEETLVSMIKNQENGEYILRFMMEGALGNVYTLSRRFIISV